LKFDSTFIRFKRDKMSKGVVLLVSAEFCFALATVFTKFVTKDSTLTGIEVTFFRFALGLLVAIAMVYKEKTPLRPNNISMVIWRGVLNTIAVILFFSANELPRRKRTRYPKVLKSEKFVNHPL